MNFADNTVTSASGNIFVVPKANEYDSTDTAIVTAVSTQKKAITFYNLSLKKLYTLNYDSSTRFADSYNTAITVAQLKPGTLVDVLFLKSGKKLVSLVGSQDCFVMSDVTGFSIDSHGVFRYKSENYEINDATILISSDEKMDIADLTSLDEVTLVGKDSVLYSIIVDRGHGYLSLSQHEHFVGGYLELSSKQIERINDKMLVTLPEGKYTVVVTKNTLTATREIEILPNKETVLSLGDVEIPELKYGKVTFETTPENVVLYVDGKKMSANEPLQLEYGVHHLRAEAYGYETFSRYFKVAEENARLPLILDKDSSTSSDKKDEEDKEDAGRGDDESATDGYFLYINSPAEVEVYIDNYYVGMAPLMVVKSAGSHVITLKKSGFVTRSYNIMVMEEEGDLSYSFDELLPETKSLESTENSGN